VALLAVADQWSCCGGEMAMLDGGGRRPLWRERSSCWEPENPPCFCFVPSLFLFLLSSIWPLFSVPFSLLSSCFPHCHCLLSFSKNFAPQFVPLCLKKIVPPPTFLFCFLPKNPPPGSVLSPVFIGSRGRGSPYPVQAQGMVAGAWVF